MGEGVKRDIKLLLFLAVALALFNVLSLQFFLFSSGGNGMRLDLPEDVLPPSQERQQDVVVTNPTDEGADENADSGVYRYINDRLKSYGYDPITPGGNSPGSSGDGSGSSSSSSGGGGDDSSSNDDTGVGSDDSGSSQDGDGGDDSGSGDDGSQDDDGGDDSGLGDDGSQDGGDDNPLDDEVPPNEDGPPAESVEGDVTFNFGFGVK